MKRDTSIDIARGIAIIAVVVGHLWCWHPEYISIRKYVYCFHMPLFFMIAGMCLRMDTTGLKQFVLRKCKRLIVPYVVFGISALILYTIAVAFLYNQSSSALMTFATKRFFGFLYGTTCPVKLSESFTVCEAGMIWFLLALFISFVIVATLGKNVHGWIIITVLAILAVVLKWIGCPLLPFSLQVACIGALFVGVGMLLNKLLSKISDRLVCKVLLVLLGCCVYTLVVLCGFSQNIARIEFDSALVPVCSLVISAGVIGLSGFLKYVPCLCPLLSFIGRHTLIIYGIHHIYISGGLASIAYRCVKQFPSSRVALLVVELLFPFVIGLAWGFFAEKVYKVKRSVECTD